MSQDIIPTQVVFNKALELHQKGDLDAAEMNYDKVLSEDPHNFVALANRGAIHLLKGQWQAAEVHLSQAFEVNVSDPQLCYQIGVACQQQGNFEKATAFYQQALALRPVYPEAYTNLGIICKEQSKVDEAIVYYEQALSQNPNLAETYSNLGFALLEQDRLEEAALACQKAIQLRPDLPVAYVNLGCILHAQGYLDEAVAVYQKAIALRPDYAETYHNLGLVFYCLGRIEAAIAHYQQALALREHYPEAHFSLANAYLISGEYLKGWQEYEWRVAFKKNMYKMPSSIEQWSGHLTEIQELILVEEQGVGDIIQFSRYGKLLKQSCQTVSIAVRKPLCALMEMTGIFDHVYQLPIQDAKLSPSVKWTYLLSLPGLFGVSSDNPIITQRYIDVDAGSTHSWREKIRTSHLFIVGLNWQGDPATEKTAFKGRSFQLAEYEPLSSIPGVQFVSLQKGYGSEQLAASTFREQFVECQEEINQAWDWIETAAIVKNCDLIVTSDTSIAHLACAMGKPTWILLKKVPDWRWGLQGESSPWYPSARLFRQVEDGNWPEVMERVQSELLNLLDVR